MGGKVLKLQSQKWYEEGMEEGIKEEQANTEREKKRAEEAEAERDEVKLQLQDALKEIERLKAAAN